MFSKSKAMFDHTLNLVLAKTIAQPITICKKILAIKLKVDYIHAFCLSDESSITDSNSRRIIDIVVNSINAINEKHLGQVWNIFVLNEKYELFLQSNITKEYMNIDF